MTPWVFLEVLPMEMGRRKRSDLFWKMAELRESLFLILLYLSIDGRAQGMPEGRSQAWAPPISRQGDLAKGPRSRCPCDAIFCLSPSPPPPR